MTREKHVTINLDGAKRIKAIADQKAWGKLVKLAEAVEEMNIRELEEKQKEIGWLKYSIETDYLALRKLLGEEADTYIRSLLK